MNAVEENYNVLVKIPSDINEHLPVLKKYAEQCDHVTEMGVRYIVSTFALVLAKPKKLMWMSVTGAGGSSLIVES